MRPPWSSSNRRIRSILTNRMGLAYEGQGDASKARELYRQAADFHALNNFNYAFIRRRASERAS